MEGNGKQATQKGKGAGEECYHETSSESYQGTSKISQQFQ